MIAPGARRLGGHHVMLRAGSLRLLLPQRDVGPARTLEAQPRAGARPGWFIDGDPGAPGGEQTVAALSPRLERLPSFPSGRFVLVQFAHDPAHVWYAWDEVRVLIDVNLAAHELPPVMRRPGAPVEGFVALGEALAFLSRGEALLSHVH